MLDEPFIYLWYEYVLTIISTPLNLFTMYCILLHTPPEMREYRAHLAVYQGIASLLDFVILLIRPELNFPALSGRIFGVWDTWFQLGARHALGCGAYLVGAVISSIDQLFFYKWQSLLPDNSRLKCSRIGRSIYLFTIYGLLPPLIGLSFDFLPIQKGTSSEFLKIAIQTHPTYSYLLNYSDIYTSARVPIYPDVSSITAVDFLLFWIFFYIVVSVSSKVYYIFACNRILSHALLHMSEKTRSLQKKLFRTLCIQTAIPVVSYSIPWAYYAIAIIWSPGYINQPLNNFFFAIFEMHGTNGSIGLLLLTEPYRRCTRGMLRKIPVLGKLTTLDLKRIHIFGMSSGTER